MITCFSVFREYILIIFSRLAGVKGIKGQKGEKGNKGVKGKENRNFEYRSEGFARIFHR
jgi:hypothetical protein